MRKILISLLTVALVGGGVYGATSAFFSDTETSNANIITAGSIDLKVGSTYSSVNDANGNGSFLLGDLDSNQALYTFTDLKPGDMGGGQFEIKVAKNESWACVQSTLSSTPENDLLDPEAEANDTTPVVGELQDHLQFVFWNDVNGNGLLDGGDANLPTTSFTLAQLTALGSFPLADSTSVNGPSFLTGSPLTPDISYHLGFKYCFGNFDPTYTACDGNNAAYNDAQSDSVVGTLAFSAVQSRNNMSYVCNQTLANQWLTPTPTITP